MHICREANLASSSSWMYIAYKLLLTYLILPLIDLFVYDKKGEKNFVVCFYPFVDDWQKGGEEFEIYMHVLWKKDCLCIYVLFVLQIGEKEFDVFYTC